MPLPLIAVHWKLCGLGQTRFIAKQPEAAAAIVRGIWDNIKYVKDPANKGACIAALKKYWQANDQFAEGAYQATQLLFQDPLSPRIDESTLTDYLKVIASDNAAIAKLKPSDVFDASLLDRLPDVR